ncbi:MAG: MBL fold metallo-hydrolase, partial [Myxococcota bacterium]
GLCRLMAQQPEGSVALVDAPGVTRGYASEEMVDHLVHVLQPEHVLLLVDGHQASALMEQLQDRRGLSVEVMAPPEEQRRLSRSARKTLRTQCLDAWLEGAPVSHLAPGACRVLGFQPDDVDGWKGRLVGLLGRDGATLAVGEVVGVGAAVSDEGLNHGLEVRTRANLAEVASIVVGTLHRNKDGVVVTWRPPSSPRAPRSSPSGWTLADRPHIPVPVGWPVQSGSAAFRPRMLNGLFGDPCLMLRHIQGKRALLFDLGWLEEKLPGKVLHGVTDIFISHAHMDHTHGLVTLLRALLGPGGEVRLYGPPGFEQHVASLLGTFRFNLLDEDGPVFWVHTLVDTQVHVFRLQCVDPPTLERVEVRDAPGGVMLDDDDVQVRAVEVQHSIPVLAYRAVTYSRNRCTSPDPYHPAPRTFELAYVTDVADEPENMARLVQLSRGADLLVCESTFVEADRDRAAQTRHLTTEAAARLARDAGVGRLVPFHVSVRYEDDPRAVFRELMEHFDRVFPALLPEAETSG